jgi:hypothetical protein
MILFITTPARTSNHILRLFEKRVMRGIYGSPMAAVLRCGKQMEKLPHYNFPGQSLSKKTLFGRGYGPVERQK